MTPQDQAEAFIASLKTPLSVDAGGTLTDADGVAHVMPALFATHLVAELANQLAQKSKAADMAKRFMVELLDSVETLGSIAEEHGPRTLADLFYLHSAIVEGSFIDHYPDSDESSVKTIVEDLPSAADWLPFIKEDYLLGSDDDDEDLPDPNSFPDIIVGQEYEFHAEMQEAELPAEKRMRNYTGQTVLVLSGPHDDSDDAAPVDANDPEAGNFFRVRAADGREFTASEEELSGWNKALGQFFWPDGTYGNDRDRTYLVNEKVA